MSRLAALIVAQLAADRRQTAGRPELLKRKWQRMSQSPFAFLRGAVPLFDALEGPGGPVGDLHLENFGTFVTSRGVALNVNDFDCTARGPARTDVVRLLTSVLLSRPQLNVSGTTVLELAECALEGHQCRAPTEPPEAAQWLKEQLTKDVQREWLHRRLEQPGRIRRDGEKLLEAPRALVKAVPAALKSWVQTLTPMERELGEQLTVDDVVRRVAGTGSLGVERLLALTHDLEGRPRLIELKQMRPGAERVVEVMRRALPRPPSLLGSTTLLKRSMLVRRLVPGEDKLEVGQLGTVALPAVIKHLGSLAGEVHRRTVPPATIRFNASQRKQLLVRARELAGIHEEAFLRFCEAVRELRAV